MRLEDLAGLRREEGGRVLLLVLDGLGGLPIEPGGRTELEAARTPNMDALLVRGGCGLHVPVAPGITPGSGPGHLALFGYDPLRYRIGRGVLEALGVDFDLQPGDVAARGNLCAVDDAGRVTDRRAGRISSEDARPLCERLDGIEVEGARLLVRHVKEHRFLLVIRPEEPVGEAVEDTDPGREGVEPHPPRATDAESEPTARMAAEFLAGARERLAGERANMALLRGFARLPEWPSFPEVTGLRSLAIAAYPMYRGVARLVGMDAVAVADDLPPLAEEYERRVAEHDFLFLHVKGTDKAGEDGDFDRKVHVIEEADALLPRLLATEPDVVLITGDHSTPARMRSHSWHPVPFLLAGGPALRETAASFGETACAAGSLGTLRGCDLLPLALARAGRLSKYGA